MFDICNQNYILFALHMYIKQRESSHIYCVSTVKFTLILNN